MKTKFMSNAEIVKKLKELPNEEDLCWLCQKCGESRYNKRVGVATWHIGICDLCKNKTSVTERRDFKNGENII